MCATMYNPCIWLHSTELPFWWCPLIIWHLSLPFLLYSSSLHKKTPKNKQTKPYQAEHETQQKQILQATVLQLEQKISFKKSCLYN